MPTRRADPSAAPAARAGHLASRRRGRATICGVRGVATFLRENPQVLILLIICVMLGLGTFVVVLLGVASSGSTTTNGYPQDVILGAHALLG